jgi:hypothetical protein
MWVDGEALPGDPAERERGTQRLAESRDRQRTDDVAAAPDPEDERPAGGLDSLDQDRALRYSQ